LIIIVSHQVFIIAIIEFFIWFRTGKTARASSFPWWWIIWVRVIWDFT
jgi:hypothetical protein